MIEKELYKLIKKAIKRNEVPVAAIIVKNGKIISTGINNREIKNNVMGHAEIIVIKKAAKKLKTWKLSECILYTTLKPCNMCEEIIKNSRIKKVYYYLENYNKNNFKTEYIKINKNENFKFEKELKNFFKIIRKNK